MNLDNVRYANILIKLKDGKAVEFEMRNCESVTEHQIQQMIPPLRIELRRIKSVHVAKMNEQKRLAEEEEAKAAAEDEDLDALANLAGGSVW